MGENGAGKDTFAATWPGPRKVLHLDGVGQEMPYMKGAKDVTEIKEYQMPYGVIPYRDIVAADDSFTRVEYYSSDNPTLPHIAPVLEAQISMFAQEQSNWGTLICGSLSSAALENRLIEQFVLNPGYKDPRKWYGAATEYVERLIFAQKALKCNVVFICHIGRDKDEVGGEYLFGPDLPGRLSYSAGRYFNEMYRMFLWRDKEGIAHRYLQVDNDGRYQCKTHIDASNPCGPNPTYEMLWGNWK
jgi:hypothetical protein